MSTNKSTPLHNEQAVAPAKKTRRWRRKIALLIVVLGLTFITVFNPSTRYGRWLFWQDADWGDINRFPSREVKHDPKRVAAFRDGDVTAISNVIHDLRFADRPVRELMEVNDATAFIVVHDNRIVIEDYFQGNQRSSLQSTFSCTKSFLSVLVGQAIDNGLIGSVDDSLDTYVGDLDPSVGAVSLSDLLSMSSGISDSKAKLFGVTAPWSDKVIAYYEPDFRSFSPSIRLTHPPGSRFEYHDWNPLLVGMALEAATGKSLTELLKTGVWDAMGAEGDAIWSLDHSRSGLEKTEAGLHVRGIDMARFGSAMASERNSLISKTWWHESTQDTHGPGPEGKWTQLAESRLAGGKFSTELSEYIKSLRYGYYWWIVKNGDRTDFYANGRFGQFIYVSPAAKLVIVRCGPSHGQLDDFQYGFIFHRIASTVLSVIHTGR